MEYYGHDDLALLDGGTKQWIEAGDEVEYGESRPRRGRHRATITTTRAMTRNTILGAIPGGC